MKSRPWTRLPVRRRVALVYAGLAAATVGLLTLIVFWSARGAMFAALDDHLHRDLELTLTALDFGEAARLRPFVHARPSPDDPDPTFQLWRYGALQLAHPAVDNVLADVPSPAAAAPFFSATVRGRSLRVHELPLAAIGDGWVLRVARDEGALHRELRSLVARLAALALVVGALGVGLAAWASRRALLPLVNMVEVLRGLGPQRLQTRLPVPPTGDEVALLAESHNAMLDRIESGYRDVERFAALIAHELRTPLASLRTAAEVALSAPPPQDAGRLAETLRTTLEETDRLAQLTNRLLLLGRTPVTARRHHFDARALLREAVDLLQPLAEERGHRLLVLDGPAVELQSDRVIVMQIVLDLVDNALRHGGDAVTVTLNAAAVDGGVRVTVGDDGVGLPPPGAPSGTGLGMELARRLAATLSGSMKWTSHPGGGTEATITLQAPAPPDDIESSH